ncbi:uncharacterized protein H6S33_006396 [Morchella sextelata]|uniref:uncharacterized protein n=1 Tax=Morchella sextelata TaxID=1174677 RepID=UPI001D038C2A|nr:uncharacterized protein H6S33_006396 [Morchella sextelata]KAH0604728.1 hypothetical protein H6S33_006396 [Morchella sextelata]
MPGIIVQEAPEDGASASSSSSTAGVELSQLSLQAPRMTRPRPDRVTVRNRRLQYLAKNSPTYFSSPDLELADPLLYDRLIRQHQSPAEREAEGRKKGWSGILHADLSRSEAKIDALRDSDATTLETRAENSVGETVTSKEEAEQVWRETMTLRFLEGRDEDADYESIDNSEEYDDYRQIERDAQDAYFDAESPSEEGAGAGDTGVQDF